nr:efflux transporter outer membrane subunit [Motiliproteus sp. SC1-56]
MLTGCLPGSARPVLAPEFTPPPRWQQPAPEGAVETAWLRRVASPQLRELVIEALAANPDLHRAEARLSEALAQAQVAGAPLKPALDASIEGGRAKRSSGGGAADDYSYALTLGYELDLWGKLSDAARAAILDAEAEQQAMRRTRQTLVADLTRDWFAATEALRQRDLSRQLVDNLANSLEVLEEGFRSGLISALDIHLARANLSAERSRLAQREQALGDARRTLAQRLGRYPGASPTVAAELPPFPGPVPVGLPAALLERRPDIRSAHLRLARDEAELARRYKDRFPSLRLSARLGAGSEELGDLFDADQVVWSLLAGLTQPLYDGHRLEALEAAARARADQRVGDYLDTLLQAFNEVESALQQEAALALQVQALSDARLESERAEELAVEQYQAGLVDFITVLEAQRRAFNARSAFLQAQAARWRNRIDLYLALGGDFISVEDSNGASTEPAGAGDQPRG